MNVSMYRTSDSENDTDPLATWVVEKPDGTFLDTTGSPTQGLQEAMNYAADNGYDLRVYGGGIARKNGQDVAIIMCTAALFIPPLQGTDWYIHASLCFGGTPQPVAIDIDSMMNCSLTWAGQIVVSAGWGMGVSFRPRNELPQDPFGPCVTASKIFLGSVVMVSGGICIDMDASEGAITGNILELCEPNGGAIGVRVQAGAATCFDHNTINIRECHGQNTCINAGWATANAAQIFGNTWNVATYPTNGVGVEIFGRNDRWIISVDDREGNPINGVTLNPGAQKNIIDILMNDATVNKINDASGNNTNRITMP